MLDAASFVLSNNNFQFDIFMFLQLVGTAMGTKFDSPYAYLSIGYLEETILFPSLSPLHFTLMDASWLRKCLNVLWMMVLFYGQKMLDVLSIDVLRDLISMYLESFLMNYIPHGNLQ